MACEHRQANGALTIHNGGQGPGVCPCTRSRASSTNPRTGEGSTTHEGTDRHIAVGRHGESGTTQCVRGRQSHCGGRTETCWRSGESGAHRQHRGGHRQARGRGVHRIFLDALRIRALHRRLLERDCAHHRRQGLQTQTQFRAPFRLVPHQIPRVIRCGDTAVLRRWLLLHVRSHEEDHRRQRRPGAPERQPHGTGRGPCGRGDQRLPRRVWPAPKHQGSQ